MNDPRALDEAAPGRLDDCWNRIGIGGDRTCPELKAHVHCRNCPVHSAAARRFFDRPAPPGYLDEWTRWLADASEGDESREIVSHRDGQGRRDDVGALIFRLGPEWLAFRTRAVVEAALPRPVHRVPHRTNAVFRGLVNLRGQLQLCFCLYGLLGVPEPGREPDEKAESRRRLVVLRDVERSESWAFAVDEIHGVEHFAREDLRNVPSTLANPAVSFSQAVVAWDGRTIGLLDESRVFASLRSVGQ